MQQDSSSDQVLQWDESGLVIIFFLSQKNAIEKLCDCNDKIESIFTTNTLEYNTITSSTNNNECIQ